MSRYSRPSSYGHRVRYVPEWDYYRLSWTSDRYYEGSQLRHPYVRTRDTDRKGAERFAKKWKVEILNDPKKAVPPPAKPCRHRVPQHAETIAGTLVYRETKTGKRRYRVKCTACGCTREVGIDTIMAIDAALRRSR
jgi:hypothetical protein